MLSDVDALKSHFQMSRKAVKLINSKVSLFLFSKHKTLDMVKLRKCVGKENLQRLNYLYQVGTNYARSNYKQNNLLSSYYMNLMISISKKTVQRLELNIKRNICKICKNICVPGKNCKVRIKRQKIQYNCNICNSSKKYIAQEANLWSEQTQSVNEILDYSQNKS
ncbi:RNAse P Rpr2/Rpp21/SNM1 subunit domain [Popillia japonica]|uniref:RNAse P Rpr2/Rpp21/SNM1 subunit domain n=1 Tax=Popillia japonica TaxID=7064 RepID=A0AAW1NK44_POPJA